MIWREHSKLKGKHAYMGASSPYWLNDETPIERYAKSFAQEIGTLIHAYAEKKIQFKTKLKKTSKDDLIFWLRCGGIPENVINVYDFNAIFNTLYCYVKDSIDSNLDSEVILYYSDLCFGTADAINFNEQTKTLSIYDLKTGTTSPKPEQLMIYAALFCIEYGYNPDGINYDLRFYTIDEILQITPDEREIANIAQKIRKNTKDITGFLENN